MRRVISTSRRVVFREVAGGTGRSLGAARRWKERPIAASFFVPFFFTNKTSATAKRTPPRVLLSHELRSCEAAAAVRGAEAAEDGAPCTHVDARFDFARSVAAARARAAVGLERRA